LIHSKFVLGDFRKLNGKGILFVLSPKNRLEKKRLKKYDKRKSKLKPRISPIDLRGQKNEESLENDWK